MAEFDVSAALKNVLISAKDVGVAELQKTLSQANSGSQPPTLDEPQIRPDPKDIPIEQPKPTFYKKPLFIGGVVVASALVLFFVMKKRK